MTGLKVKKNGVWEKILTGTNHTHKINSIIDSPIKIDNEGYTNINGMRQVTNISNVLDGQTITITMTLEGGKTAIDTIQLNENGFPASGVSNGIPWTMSWTGFDNFGAVNTTLIESINSEIDNINGEVI